MTDLIVIPARWNSSRFPGKPLALIGGRTLLARAVDLARRAVRGLPDVDLTVATDDPGIADHAREAGVAVVMTDPAIASGSARALAAAQMQRHSPGLIVNLQGDAPFMPVGALRQVLAALQQGASVATPVVQLSWAGLDALRQHKRAAPFSGTTCVRAPDGEARWFSKSIIPAIRNEAELRATATLSPVFRHLGLYGYTRNALDRFEASPPTAQEQLEGLEQLRFFELSIPVYTVCVEEPPISMSGIDTPEDVALAEQLLALHGDPYGT